MKTNLSGLIPAISLCHMVVNMHCLDNEHAILEQILSVIPIMRQMSFWFLHLHLTGKVGAILASIPLAMAAAILCFMWAFIVALGLANLQYSQAASFRNVIVVGISLFLGLSVPAYFQQYNSETSLILPSYFVPYAAASDGPVHTGSQQVSYSSKLCSVKLYFDIFIGQDCITQQFEENLSNSNKFSGKTGSWRF